MSVVFRKIKPAGWGFLFSFVVSFLILVADVQAKPIASKPLNDEDAICGVWYTNNNNSKVEIFKKNGLYFGKLIWLKDPGKAGYTDKLVILDMTYNNSRHLWDKGTLYYPVKDTRYQGIIELFDNDTLFIRAFKGTPLIGKTVTWIRVK